MLDPYMKSQLQDQLHHIVIPIELTASLNDSAASAELRELLREIASLSTKVMLHSDDGGAGRRPSFVIHRPGTMVHTEFAGIPLGHEFTSLVLALLQVGGQPPRLPPEIVAQVRALEGEYVFETFVTQGCHNCPDVVQALNAMAVINPNIRHVSIDATLFRHEVDERGIRSVPSIWLNDRPFGLGRMTPGEILAKLGAGGS